MNFIFLNLVWKDGVKWWTGNAGEKKMAQVVAAFYINMPAASITLCDGLGVKLRNFTKKKRLPPLIRASRYCSRSHHRSQWDDHGRLAGTQATGSSAPSLTLSTSPELWTRFLRHSEAVQPRWMSQNNGGQQQSASGQTPSSDRSRKRSTEVWIPNTATEKNGGGASQQDALIHHDFFFWEMWRESRLHLP